MTADSQIKDLGSALEHTTEEIFQNSPCYSNFITKMNDNAILTSEKTKYRLWWISHPNLNLQYVPLKETINLESS